MCPCAEGMGGGERAFYSQTSQLKLLFPIIISLFTFKTVAPTYMRGRDRPGDTSLIPGAAHSSCSHSVEESINAHANTHIVYINW